LAVFRVPSPSSQAWDPFLSPLGGPECSLGVLTHEATHGSIVACDIITGAVVVGTEATHGGLVACDFITGAVVVGTGVLTHVGHVGHVRAVVGFAEGISGSLEAFHIVGGAVVEVGAGVISAEFIFGGLVACDIIPFAVGEVGATVFLGGTRVLTGVLTHGVLTHVRAVVGFAEGISGSLEAFQIVGGAVCEVGAGVLGAEFIFGGLVACVIIPFAVGEVGATVFLGAIFLSECLGLLLAILGGARMLTRVLTHVVHVGHVGAVVGFAKGISGILEAFLIVGIAV